jgi:hypothetical protein
VRAFTTIVVASVCAIGWLSVRGAAQDRSAVPPPALFQSATHCMACHDGLTAASGEDVSIGTSWRASMMAHAALDPYWQAGVRREITDHPLAAGAIENECSRCHMPMAHAQAQTAGRRMSVFANTVAAPAPDPFALEAVSCTLCHQMTSAKLGHKESFSGGFVVDTTIPAGERQLFGPHQIDGGRVGVMHSASGFRPAAAAHLQESDACATCHTLYTHPLDAAGEPIGEFPEQVPYQEWLRSAFRTTASCQSCHMPALDEPTPMTSVLPEPRPAVSRHDFRAGNFFMLRLLNRFRHELGVTARPAELDAAVMRTMSFLQSSAATIEIANVERLGGRLVSDIVVRNLAGHKLPTAYPSRRVWLHVSIRDGQGRVVFSSGTLQSNGVIAGNDNDRDPSAVEPHYREITAPEQVQIYEAIMGTRSGSVTTGLLSAVVYLKDNRILPRGLDKHAAPDDVAVRGGALDDSDFSGGEDRVRYAVDVTGTAGPFTVEAAIWYQPIGYRWAENLRAYSAFEPQRFAKYYDAMGTSSAVLLARASVSAGR